MICFYKIQLNLLFVCIPTPSWTSLGAQLVKNLPAVQETQV